MVKTMWENVVDVGKHESKVIYDLEKPFKPEGGIVVLRGNLSPPMAPY